MRSQSGAVILPQRLGSGPALSDRLRRGSVTTTLGSSYHYMTVMTRNCCQVSHSFFDDTCSPLCCSSGLGSRMSSPCWERLESPFVVWDPSDLGQRSSCPRNSKCRALHITDADHLPLCLSGIKASLCAALFIGATRWMKVPHCGSLLWSRPSQNRTALQTWNRHPSKLCSLRFWFWQLPALQKSPWKLDLHF